MDVSRLVQRLQILNNLARRGVIATNKVNRWSGNVANEFPSSVKTNSTCTANFQNQLCCLKTETDQGDLLGDWTDQIQPQA